MNDSLFFLQNKRRVASAVNLTFTGHPQIFYKLLGAGEMEVSDPGLMSLNLFKKKKKKLRLMLKCQDRN